MLINAHVYNPAKNIFGDKKGKSQTFEYYCERPEECDMHKKRSVYNGR